MNTKELRKRYGSALDILLAIPSTTDRTNEQAERTALAYLVFLRDWTPAFANSVAEYALQTCEWRPAPAKIRSLAARMASPYPSVDDAFDEIVYKARKYGLMAAPHPTFPDNPNIKSFGPPEFSHPIVTRLVNDCGGWAEVCARDNMGVLKAQMERAYDRRETEWVNAVARELPRIVKGGTLNSKAFPEWRPFRAPMIEEIQEEYRARNLPKGGGVEVLDRIRANVRRVSGKEPVVEPKAIPPLQEQPPMPPEVPGTGIIEAKFKGEG